MIDEIRQSRIEAGDAGDNTHPPLQKNENRTILSDPDLRIDVRLQDDYLMLDVVRNPGTVHMHGRHIPIALAADAIGRERVSERTKEHVYIAINNALASHIDISSDTDWWDEVIVEMGDAAMGTLLTAAPAERGHDETR